MCEGGRLLPETTNNLFFECPMDGYLTIGWESYHLSNNSLVHINQFKGLLFHGKMLRERFHVIWLACI